MSRGRSVLKAVLPLLAVLAACAPVAQNGSDEAVASDEAAAAADGAILARSDPGDGATVRAPRHLSLAFREPVRLVEVIVAGPAGEMPMMVNAAGEQASYTLPLSDLEPGRHEVRWRARAQDGVSHEGRLSFTVR